MNLTRFLIRKWYCVTGWTRVRSETRNTAMLIFLFFCGYDGTDGKENDIFHYPLDQRGWDKVPGLHALKCARIEKHAILRNTIS